MNHLHITFLCFCLFNSNIQISETLTDEDKSVTIHSTTDKLVNITKDAIISTPNNQSLDLPKWTDWSSWSRCRRCSQKRMKICMKASCEFRKMYQERHCKSRRCRRRRKQQENFHVVMPEKKFSTKMAYTTSWSSWTPWSMCSYNCRTFRRRYCRTPGRCKQRRQVQKAYCYHGNTDCQMFVYNLMSIKDQFSGHHGYSFNEKPTRRRENSKNPIRCGLQFQKSRMLKIIGGVESPKYKWPWHVALINQFAEVFCGGTLIAPEWVLTASHCVRSFLRVRLNEHDLRYADGRELELVVHKIYQHPEFSQRTVNGDIALLQLPFAVKTPVACLPNRKPIPRQICSVMGWGKIRTLSRSGVSLLRETQIPIVEDSVCKWAYSDLLITENMVCAGWPSGKSDTCAGDSGGGLMCPHKRSNSGRIMYSVQGITSFGKGCGKRNKYGIYTVVYNYLNWIEYIMTQYRYS